MEELLYWITEYCKVFLCYGILMFLWPMIVFKKFLAGKSATFRFSFCVTGQVVLINTVVLMLGLLHVLNVWTVRILFYVPLIISLRDYYMPTKERRKKLRYLVNGTFGWKNFLLLERRKLIRSVEKFLVRIGQFYKKHWMEYSLLLAALIYGMIYFSWGAFHSNSYGSGDMYVHHSWIYGLVEGKVFSAGVYPEAMHCVIYSMHALFGVKIYNCLLFLAGIHVVLILIAAYCFLKEIFAWRFSPVLALVLFLVLDVMCINALSGMSRLQWTIPQEYGFYTIYLCALYLLRYLKSKKHWTFRGKKTKGCWDENLLIFTLALAASIAIHFYVTIIAFFFCAAVALFSLRNIFNKKHFLPLVAGVMAGVMIAVAPMGAALASGIPFQGSINWAVRVINGTETENGRTQEAQSYLEQEREALSQANGQQPGTSQNSSAPVDSSLSEERETTPSFVEQLWEKLQSVWNRATAFAIAKLTALYENAYVVLYGAERAVLFVAVSVALVVVCLLVTLVTFIYAKRKKTEWKAKRFATEYPMLVAAVTMLMVLYAAPYLGLPELIAGDRLCSNIQLLFLSMLVIPLDILFTGMSKKLPLAVVNCGAVLVAAGLVAGIYVTGNYHGYLYYELTRYNAAVNVTEQITEILPKYTYTVISTTSEQYQVIQSGRHEELLTFFSEEKEQNYFLPTEYVFIFVEKQPVEYAQIQVFSGPDWLADKKSEAFFMNHSVWPKVNHSEISKEYAAMEIQRFKSKPSLSYSYLDSRTILESKMQEWCETFEEVYPNELKVFYEDDAFVCYYFRQNVHSLYNLNME